MATAASKTPGRKASWPKLSLPAHLGQEILGVVLLAVVLLLTLSLVSYDPNDPSAVHRPAEQAAVANLVGPFGANLAAIVFAVLGLSGLLVPLALARVAWQRLKQRPADNPAVRVVGAVLVLLALPALVELTVGEIHYAEVPHHAGGALGSVIAGALTPNLNFGGAFVVLLAIFLVGGSLAVQSTLGELMHAVRGWLGARWARLELLRSRRRERQSKADRGQRVVRHHLEAARRGRTDPSSSSAAAEPKIELPPVRVKARKGEGQFSVRKVALTAAGEPPTGTPPAAAAAPARKVPPRQEQLDFLPTEAAPSTLPPINLLDMGRDETKRDERALVRRGELIQRSCQEFGVEGSIEGIGPGPVITVYELQPAPGVKVSRIVNLQDDLALALKAESVRIDRIPGRSTLGIEVPNRTRSVIHLGHLLADEAFARAPSVLTMAIGVDIHGRPHYADLATMPHLLVAGATGAGKSVGLQSMITSIIYKATREQVQFIFIDPKRIELGVYADIPHLKTEVVVEPKKAANALRWAVSEMERRYRLLAEVHVRSIAFYNQAIRDPKVRDRLALTDADADGEVRPEDLKPLPYYVIVIDELADLMMVSASDVETSIARLAQMARAVGIHLIVATQRPSVDVLTGTIKANFPCRLAYATATRHDSRTILDQVGSEKLLGKGDALFMPPGTSRIQRLHGAYISEQETASLIRWLKKHGKPELDMTVVSDPEGGAGGDGKRGGKDGGGDDLFDEAARLVVKERMASASFLQRRMRVGFSRAARLIDMMEADGLLGPAQGSKPRDVLVPPDFFEEIDAARMA